MNKSIAKQRSTVQLWQSKQEDTAKETCTPIFQAALRNHHSSQEHPRISQNFAVKSLSYTGRRTFPFLVLWFYPILDWNLQASHKINCTETFASSCFSQPTCSYLPLKASKFSSRHSGHMLVFSSYPLNLMHSDSLLELCELQIPFGHKTLYCGSSYIVCKSLFTSTQATGAPGLCRRCGFGPNQQAGLSRRWTKRSAK